MEAKHCEACRLHYGDDGVCDRGRPLNSPHRAPPSNTCDGCGRQLGHSRRLCIDCERLARLPRAFLLKRGKSWVRCRACSEAGAESDGLCEGCREARDLYEGACAAARRRGGLLPDEPGEVSW